MRINHNISALKANNQLAKTNNALDKSLERLSSGYRINHAADDSAGLAISEKMKTQIAGLDQASRNASDGISVMQTAEGALSEVESMLQRMRELAVESANGTYTSSDRESIQSEMLQLKDEINRISDTTEFNTMKLLNGDSERKSNSSNSNVSMLSISDSVMIGDYKLTVDQDARQAVLVGDTIDMGAQTDPELRKISATEAGTITINGEEVKIEAGDTFNQVFDKISKTCDTVNVNVFAASSLVADVDKNLDKAGYKASPLADGENLVFVSDEYGSDTKVKISCDNASLCTLLGLSVSEASAEGVDSKVTLTNKALDSKAMFENTATVSVSGNQVTVSDNDDFKMVFNIKPGTVETKFYDQKVGVAPIASHIDPSGSPTPATVVMSILDAGPMDLQIGANENQTMAVTIPRIDAETLGIKNLNLGTEDGAEKAIEQLDNAVKIVSAIRSKMGAYQNRLEHSISNLDTSSENMTESMSRIADVDMAGEMATYTQKNVLAQAGTSMLAQANQRPQEILSLLQG